MSKKWFVVFLTLVICSSFLVGCEGKKEIENLRKTVTALEEENKQLKEKLAGMNISEVIPESSLREVEGSTVPEFQTIDGKIKFPNKLEVSNSKDDVNNSYVRVGSVFNFYPSNNWIIKLDGSTLELSHPSKVWGRVKAISVEESVPEENMRGLLQKFYNKFPATTVSYRKVFMDDRVVGMLSRAEIKVDKKPYIINVGFAVRGDYGVLFLFAYEKGESTVQQELVDLFISSGTYSDAKISLE